MESSYRATVLCALVLWSQSAGAEDTGTAKVTGIYQGMTGTITVTALDASKLHAAFALQAIGQPNTGETSGDGLLKGGAATIVPDASAPCSFTLKFSGKTLNVEQTGMSNECGFGANVTADGDYKWTKAVPLPPPPELIIPGVPNEAECKRVSQLRFAPGKTQLELNEAEGEKATQAACTIRAPYSKLDKAARAKFNAADALRAAQAAWDKFLIAHDREVYPHQDEQGYYGSMHGMCSAGQSQVMYKARAKELDGLRACSDPPSAAAKAEQQAQAAEAAHTAAAAKVKAAYAKDPVFVKAFIRAEIAYSLVVNAHKAYASAASGQNTACVAREAARVLAVRTAQINQWLKKATPSGCNESYGPP